MHHDSAWAVQKATAGSHHDPAVFCVQAYEQAYRDVSAAFAQFLTEVDAEVDGEASTVLGTPRPLVLVGHSQGARHVRALLTEFFDHDGLADRLVVAYGVGVGVDAEGDHEPVLVEVPADVLASDVRRRTDAWHAARSGPAQSDAQSDSQWHVLDLPGPAGADTTPVVLLHKLGGWAADWRGVATELATERRVLVVDLPGHGDSVRTGPSPWIVWPRETARGVAEQLRTRGVERAHLVGCSLGGVVALLHAVADPDAVESLTLIGTSLTPRFTAARTLEMDRAVRTGSGCAFGPGWVPRPGHHARASTADPQVLADQDASRARAGRWVRPSERGVGLTGVEHLLGLVEVPTMYLNGEHAGYRSYETTARTHLRDVRVEVVAAAGSFPHQERPDEVVARWRSFVAALR